MIECSPARQEARVEIPDIIGALSGLQIFFVKTVDGYMGHDNIDSS